MMMKIEIRLESGIAERMEGRSARKEIALFKDRELEILNVN
jgi:hypothetical protein